MYSSHLITILTSSLAVILNLENGSASDGHGNLSPADEPYLGLTDEPSSLTNESEDEPDGYNANNIEQGNKKVLHFSISCCNFVCKKDLAADDEPHQGASSQMDIVPPHTPKSLPQKRKQGKYFLLLSFLHLISQDIIFLHVMTNHFHSELSSHIILLHIFP